MWTRPLWPVLAVALQVLLAAHPGRADGETYPLPFYRPLSLQTPPLSGSDVYLLTALLGRSKSSPGLPITNTFDKTVSAALSGFQSEVQLPVTGTLDAKCAAVVIDKLQNDGFVDTSVPEKMGYMYKVFIPVHLNRSIELMGTLFTANNTPIHTFRTRTHGHSLGNTTWPDFNNTDPGISQFGNLGNTPTGLYEFDLNSPEDIPSEFGPYPVNRATIGLVGNAKITTPILRYGLLLHTGEWPNWQPGMSMPNSDGCIHTYPDDVKIIARLLTEIGVQIRPNPFGTQPYPFKSQGLLAVQLVNDV